MLGFNHLSRWIMGATAKKRHKENMEDFNNVFDINAAQDSYKVPEEIKALRGKAVTPWWRSKKDPRENREEASKKGSEDPHLNIVTALDKIYKSITDRELATEDLQTVGMAIAYCTEYETAHTKRPRYTWTGQRRLDWVRAVKWRLVLMLAQACEDKIRAKDTDTIEFVKGAMDVLAKADEEHPDCQTWSITKEATAIQMVDMNKNKVDYQSALHGLELIRGIAQENLGITQDTAKKAPSSDDGLPKLHISI